MIRLVVFDAFDQLAIYDRLRNKKYGFIEYELKLKALCEYRDKSGPDLVSYFLVAYLSADHPVRVCRYVLEYLNSGNTGICRATGHPSLISVIVEHDGRLCGNN
jgi:hypothetical protein